MKRKSQMITLLLSITFFIFSNLGIGMLPAIAMPNVPGEGADYELTKSTINMDDFYFCGENIDRDTCEEIPGVVTPDSGDKAPVADAGSNQTITGPATVHLNGTGSYDPNGKPITYSWTQSSGPSVSLMNPTTATPYFDAPLPYGQSDTYTFTLEVSNGEKTDIDSVIVLVENENAGGSCSDYDYVYPDCIETYDDGTIYPDSEATIVKALDGNLYECIEWGWCHDPNTMETYAPGEGSDWQDAWDLYETCSDKKASS